MTTCRPRTAPSFLAVAIHLCLLGIVVQAAGMEGRDGGFYIGFETGMTEASALETALSGINHPTKCDVLLYDEPSLAPGSDPECMDNTPRGLTVNSFDLGSRFAGGLSFGYDLGRLRLELEHLARHQGGDTLPVRTPAGNVALAGKANEWNPIDPPTETVSDFSSRELFLNVIRDFENDTSWTPFVGVGAGWARTELRFRARFVRKTLAQGYQDIDPPLTLADRPAAAAGTLSVLDSEFSDTLFGYQVVAGFDHALGDNASFTIKARWSRFDELGGTETWTLIRSHEPVQADGSTPFNSRLDVDGIEYVGVTTGLRYRF